MHPQFKFIHVPIAGMTIAYQINDADQTVTFASAYTNPKDQFTKAIGREIAKGRILKQGRDHSDVPVHLRAATLPLSDIGGSTRYRDISTWLIRESSENWNARVIPH